MKKLVSISLSLALLMTLILVTIPVHATEESDAVDWVVFEPTFVGLNDIKDVLGYRPRITYSSGSSGEYGTVTIHFKDAEIQKMVRYDLTGKKVMMSNHDLFMLLHGELEQFAYPLKDAYILYEKVVEEDGRTVYRSAVAEGTLFFSDSGKLFFYVNDLEYSKCVFMNYEMYGDDIIVPASIVAQAVYDLSMKK